MRSYPAFYAAHGGLLFLSRYEGFGIPIVEAMASGTPVIAANFASLPEVAGDAGIIVDVSQPAAIADVVQDLASNPARRDSLIAHGYLRAEFHLGSMCRPRRRGDETGTSMTMPALSNSNAQPIYLAFPLGTVHGWGVCGRMITCGELARRVAGRALHAGASTRAGGR